MLKTKNYKHYNSDAYDKKIVNMTEYFSQDLMCNFVKFENIQLLTDLLKRLTSKSEKTQAHQNQIFFSFNSTNTTYYGILIDF